MKIIVASENPAKIASVQAGFEAIFPNETLEITGVAAKSGVSDQPMSEEETLRGAENRARHAQELVPNADFWVGLEGGMEDIDGKLAAFAWIIVISKDGTVGKGEAGRHFAPAKVAELVRSGIELGHACDMVFDRHNSKHSTGMVGILTNGAIDRSAYYTQAVILALIPHINQELEF